MIKKLCGWFGVIISIGIASLWSYWGIVENFHEGWYSISLLENIFIMLIQYLSIPIIIVVFNLIAIKWNRVGGIVFYIAAVALAFFFRNGSFQTIGLLIVIPLLIIGTLYFFGKPEPKKLAYLLMIFVPLVIMVMFGVPNLVRVNQRVNDNNFDERIIETEDYSLVWAPHGPGWPWKGGLTWEQAKDYCSRLSEDGKTLLEEPVNIWRLPTVEECVQSSMLHNELSGGEWDEEKNIATYKLTPDKETPLWNPNKIIIYYWTANEYDEESAYIYVYNGGIWTRSKSSKYGYLAYRAVKDLKE
ncbi:MAG: hypothetical protein PWQ77_1559 [Kosmotogales bacterium]|nr:hypothetical protein [Kosmotogales bacterium]